MRARRCALILVVLAACGDRSPPALWPEPPPPTLAKPIGIDGPVREATDVSEPADGGATTDGTADSAGPDATAQPAKTSADAPYPAGGEQPITAEPMPGERPPMPLL